MQNNNENWIKEFDGFFNKELTGFQSDDSRRNKLKSFISQLLSTKEQEVKKEIREKILDSIHFMSGGATPNEMIENYMANENRILSLLKEDKEK